MKKSNVKKYSMEFGKKENVLNYATRTYQLSRPKKVGAVMALIRECQPDTIEEWREWYFENAKTAGKNQVKITEDSIRELGERLYEKIQVVVIPEWTEAFHSLTKQDCCDYIYNLTINRTYDGYLREKSVVNGCLAKEFSDIDFEESPEELDHAGDVDYIGFVDKSRSIAFGLQIKPVTAMANFGNYSVSERMQASFDSFSRDFKGKVFIVYSVDNEINNLSVVEEIRAEIQRLRSL